MDSICFSHPKPFKQMLAPTLASSLAVANPIPEVDPVIKATFPVKSAYLIIIIPLFFLILFLSSNLFLFLFLIIIDNEYMITVII